MGQIFELILDDGSFSQQDVIGNVSQKSQDKNINDRKQKENN